MVLSPQDSIRAKQKKNICQARRPEQKKKHTQMPPFEVDATMLVQEEPENVAEVQVIIVN
jgi:hypothetical protein